MNTTAQRLDALMDERRLELGLRWKAVTEKAGITHQTLLQLRKGAEVSDLTVANVERALGWEAGSIRAITAGGDPAARRASDADPQPAPEARWWDGEIIGPSDPLREGEELRWRNEDGRRIYELTVRGLSFEAGLGLDTTPAGVIGDLRRTLAERVAQVSGDLLRSHSGS